MPRPRAAVLAAAAALAAWSAWFEPRRLVVRELELALPHWPRRLDGLRAGVLSDVHAGVPHMGLRQLARAVAALNARAPDVQLLLGDYIDTSQPWRTRLRSRDVAAELAALRAPLGTIAVIGNHDWRHSAGRRVWLELAAAGIDVLENASTRLDAGARGELWVAGLADLRHRRPDVELALADVPADAPVLLLCHDPDLFPRVPARVALTLAGHTHGGQVAIPLLRRRLIPSRYGERYARGLVVEDGRALLVSAGLGTATVPLRLLAPPEVLVLTLRSAGLAPSRRRTSR